MAFGFSHKTRGKGLFVPLPVLIAACLDGAQAVALAGMFFPFIGLMVGMVGIVTLWILGMILLPLSLKASGVELIARENGARGLLIIIGMAVTELLVSPLPAFSFAVRALYYGKGGRASSKKTPAQTLAEGPRPPFQFRARQTTVDAPSRAPAPRKRSVDLER